MQSLVDLLPTKRTVIAFILAPAMPSLLILGLGFVYPWRDAIWMAQLIGAISYFAAAILGIPIYILFALFRIRSLPIFLLAGALIGVATYTYLMPGGISRIFSNSEFNNPDALVPISAVFGLIASLSFWGIYTHGNRQRPK